MEINERIKDLRLKNKQTLEEVAQMVGVTKATVQRWESGLIANMRRDKIIKLAQALHTTPAYILGIENANFGVNNGIIGSNNNNNIFTKDKLSPIDEAILTICKNLPEKQMGEVLSYATKLLSETKEDK